MKLLLIPAAIALMATNWTVDYDNSTLGFTAVQEGKPFKGSVPFTAEIAFDPESLKDTDIQVTIHMRDIDAGDRDRNATLRTNDFLKLSAFPAAIFTASEVVKSDAGYVAKGRLAINGIEKPLDLPFTLTPEGQNTRVKGEATISRKAYEVGTGDWSDEATIADSITVTLDLVALKR